MFKKASENEQDRVFRSTVENTRNIHGIDETTFRSPVEERFQLIGLKRDFEFRRSAIKTQIAEAKSRYHGTSKGRCVPYEIVLKWERELISIADDLRKVEDKLRATKMRRAMLSEKLESFELTFFGICKEALSDEVYRRLVTMALHRRGEEVEGYNP